MMLSTNLYAKERRGAQLKVWKKSGGIVTGELIVVKSNSLLLLSTEGKDVTVDIEDIKVVTIVKKSKLLLGAGVGAAICIGGMGLAGALIGGEPPLGTSMFVFALMMGACFSPIAASLGGIIGAMAGTDKTFQIEGMTDSEIQAALDKLRKKARIRDYK